MTHSSIASVAASGSRGIAARNKQGLLDRGSLKSGAVKAVYVIAGRFTAGLFGLAESKASTTAEKGEALVETGPST